MSFGTTDIRTIGQGLIKFEGINPQAVTVADFGEAEAFAEVDRILALHNALVANMVDELCQRTTDYQAVYGGIPDNIKMIRGNEYSQPLNQKVKLAGTTVGFPLDKSEIGLQWTRRGFEQMTVERFGLLVRAALLADVKDFRKSLMRAIFSPTNDLEYEDYLVDYKSIRVYAFLNGDGTPIPAAPDGTGFPADHTHYMYATALTEDVVRDVLTNVSEHGVTGELRLFIPRSFENTIWSMKASGAFHEFLQAGIAPPLEGGYVLGKALDPGNPGNRTIGYFDSSEVVVRSWVPPKYILAVDTGTVNDKPLAYRVLPNGLNSELGLRFEDESYPLRAQVMDRFYGMSPWNRHKIAICYIDANATEYVEPTIFPGF